MKKKVQRIYEWSDGERPGPTNVELSLTNRCNLRCKSCWQRDKEEEIENYEEEISTERCIRLVDEASELNADTFQIGGGGEPLSRRKTFMKIARRVKERGMRGRVLTNGTLFDREIVEDMVKIGWDKVMISLDGPDANTNDFLRDGDESFKKCMTAIDRFSAYKDLSDSQFPRLCIAPVVSKENYDLLPEIVELASEKNVDEVTFQLLVVNSEEAEELKLKEGQMKELRGYISKAMSIAEGNGIECNAEEFCDEELVKNSNEKADLLKSRGEEFSGNKFLSLPCYRPWYYIYIYPDGSTQPCPNLPPDEDSYDDMGKKDVKNFKKINIKEESLEKIWLGKKFQEFRERLLTKNLFPWCEICCGNEAFETQQMRKKLLEKIGSK